jgi:hypothetical protein
MLTPYLSITYNSVQPVPFLPAQAHFDSREAPMIDLLGFTTLAVATIFALAAATAFQ